MRLRNKFVNLLPCGSIEALSVIPRIYPISLGRVAEGGGGSYSGWLIMSGFQAIFCLGNAMNRSSISTKTNQGRLDRQRKNQSNHDLRRRVLKAELLESRWLMTASLGLLSSDDFWSPAEPTDPSRTSVIRATEYELFSLSESNLRSELSNAPLEFTEEARNSDVVISLPRPDGSLERFTVYASPIMAAELAAQFPEIQTYAGRGIDNPAAKLRFDITPAGFHGQVLSPDGAYYIDPYYHLDTSLYASYFATGNFRVPEASLMGPSSEDFSGDLVGDSAGNSAGNSSAADNSGLTGEGPANGGESLSRTGTELRIYRTAVAATGEYTAFHGGTVALGQAAVVTAINRVSGIYESELTIRLQLVGNNSSIIYTNAATDPYSNNNPGALLSENQANLDTVIGSANYDLGHVFTTGGGGLAGLGVVGINGRKAQGETGLPNPINDAFYVDYVAHEMGHQFGGNHTFNSSTSSCGGGNRNASTAYEPGSGSTIQAYAGICGSDDLQPNSDPYFHSISFDEILRHVDVVVPRVGTRVPTGNSVPTVSAGADYTIPARTPFMLTATGTDADAADVLTYSWEQRDLGPSTTITAPDNGSSPLFRAIVPTTSPTRFFPRLSSVINQTTTRGEITPTTNRTLNFRVTVRDNHPTGAGLNTDDVRLNVVDTGATFQVTSPSTPVSWDGLTSKPVTWNVAGTNAGAINAATVSIYLSIDGGLTFPTLVLAGTPNDGSENIVVPNIPTTQARLMIRGDSNVFFNVNTSNFTIIPAPIQMNLGTGVTGYTENAAPVVAIPNGTVTDFSNTDFNGLQITASIIQNRENTDILSLINEGTAFGQFSFTATRVLYSGVDFGGWVLQSGVLTVSFNSAANATSATALLRHIGYSSSSESPGTAVKLLQVSLGAGLSGIRSIQVTTVNDSPSLVDVGLAPFDEDVPQPVGQSLTTLFATSFSDPDARARFNGIAVVSNPEDSSQGTWFFSDDQGLSWLQIDSVNDTNGSLVLSPSAWVGFRPAANFFGDPTPIMVRVLDDTFQGAYSNSILGTRRFLSPSARVVDGPVSNTTGAISVTIRNVNDAPVAALPILNIQATQDVALNSTLPPNLFSDIDSPVLSWSILAPINRSIPAWLQFDGTTRRLTGTPSNDDVGNFTLQLRATDDAGATASIPLSITVANVNDRPEQLILQGRTISENELGAKVGAISAFDPDLQDSITFSVSDNRFIVREGALYLRPSASINYEVDQTVTVTVTATDNGSPTLSTSVPFLIEIRDLNEFFPDLQPQRFLIPFNRPDNFVVGTVTAVDADTLQTVKYRIAQDDSGLFEVGESSGQVRLKSGASLRDTSYRLFISAFDNGSPSNSRIVLFNVDVEIPNQFSPVVLPGQSFTVAENSPSGTVVGRVLALDQDGDANLRFSAPAGPFTINPTSGVVSVAPGANLNFESLASYSILVQVTDSGTPARSSSAPITINLSNVNDPPTAISLVNSNVPALQKGFQLSRINVADEDPASQYVFATTDARFEIRNGTLALRPSFFFANGLAGTSSTVDVTVTDPLDSTVTRVLPLTFNIVANAAPWQNRINRLDVDRNGVVSALDALIVINALNGKTANLARGDLRVPRELTDLALLDVDTSGDNTLSPLDAALIITALNSGAGGEGESPNAVSTQPQTWFDAFTSLEQDRKRKIK